MIDTRLCYRAIKHMKICALIFELHLPQNLSHTQTDRHFPEIVKSCSGYPQTCKSIKNLKSKILTMPIHSSIYIEESKNILRNHLHLKFYLLNED